MLNLHSSSPISGEKRKQYLSEASDAVFENDRQHALGMMNFLAHEKGVVPDEYHLWSGFAADIAVEQRKRIEAKSVG